MDLFADNDELFAKLKGGNPGYDVIVPTNDMLERMIKAGMVMPLDHSKIPNMANIDKPFQDATFDPGRKHSIPTWALRQITESKIRWRGQLEDLPTATSIRAAFLLGDAQNVIGVAIKYLGHSFNSTIPGTKSRIAIAQKKHVKYLLTTMAGSACLASRCLPEWNGDISRVMEEDKDIAYAVPTGALWSAGYNGDPDRRSSSRKRPRLPELRV
jgi:spermidine/putrescine transport system substrate-binding protein